MKKLVLFLLVLFISCNNSITGNDVFEDLHELIETENVQNNTLIVEQVDLFVQPKIIKKICGNDVCEISENEYSCEQDCLIGPKRENVENCVIPPKNPRAWEVYEDTILCAGTHSFPYGVEIRGGLIFDCNNAVLKSPLLKYLSVLSDNVIIKNCNFDTLMIDVGGTFNPRKNNYRQLSNIQIVNNKFNIETPISGYEITLFTSNALIKNNDFLDKSGISLKNSEQTTIVNNKLDFVEVLSSNNNRISNNFLRSFLVLDNSKKNNVYSNKIVNTNFSGSITLMNSHNNFITNNNIGDSKVYSFNIDCDNILEGMGIPLLPLSLLGGSNNIINGNILRGSQASCGFYLDQTKSNKFANNMVEYFDQGIYLSGFFKAENSGNEFINNSVKNNKIGIKLKDFVKINVFKNNFFINNQKQIFYNTSLTNQFSNNFFDDFNKSGPYFIHTTIPSYETGWVPIIIQDETPSIVET
ncbi:hypothetical protein COV11_01645 [Candidatus Woesearchaeota archaeon CG10_big_fil_rev_8_21_14_0_10_30_7]|nr:MAG: hypothetical protein COV11_01645 [Candidatus Woesearchaeota archaeon CG10_big_fil_rev_8_21_14_0_10_30_7]